MNEPTKHILLVEDEPAHAQIVCRAFENTIKNLASAVRKLIDKKSKT